jgi:flagellar export protein FliJ
MKTVRCACGRGPATAMRDLRFWRVSVTRWNSRQIVEQARAAHQATIVVWREAAKRAHVVDTLTERWQVEESREEGRRDQRDNDELSQQIRFNRESKT